MWKQNKNVLYSKCAKAELRCHQLCSFLFACFQAEISSKQISPANPESGFSIKRTTLPLQRHRPGGNFFPPGELRRRASSRSASSVSHSPNVPGCAMLTARRREWCPKQRAPARSPRGCSLLPALPEPEPPEAEVYPTDGLLAPSPSTGWSEPSPTLRPRERFPTLRRRGREGAGVARLPR